MPSDASGAFVPDRVAQQVWGIRGLNDALLRREDRTTPNLLVVLEGEEEPLPSPVANGTFDHHWFYLTDPQLSVTGMVALSKTAGVIRSLAGRAAYDPYGNVTYSVPGDANFDGLSSAEDIFRFLDRYFAAAPFTDVDLNGERASSDIFFFLNAYFAAPQVPTGLVSAPYTANSTLLDGNLVPDSAVGYAGYLLDPETGLYLSRNRVYDAEIGRWIQRDPIGYADGMNLYQYVGSSPLMGTDPMGLTWIGNAWDSLSGGYIEYVRQQSGTAALDADTQSSFEEGLKTRRDLAAEQALQNGDNPCQMQRLNAFRQLGDAEGNAALAAYMQNNERSLGLSNQLRNGVVLTVAFGGLGAAAGSSNALLSASATLVGRGVQVYSAFEGGYQIDGGLNRVASGDADGWYQIGGGAVQAGLAFVPIGVRRPDAAGTNRTNDQLVKAIATRADAWGARQGLTGTARKIGYAKEVYAKNLLKRYQSSFGDRDLETEVSFANHAKAKYGMPGSVRLDVWRENTRAVWDYKFGATGITSAERAKIMTNGPSGISSRVMTS